MAQLPPINAGLQSPVEDPTEDAAPIAGLSLPSWGISLVLHAVLVIILGFFIKLAPKGAAAEGTRSVGIVLSASTSTGQKSFFDGSSDGQSDSKSQSNDADSGGGAPSFTDTKLTDTTGSLPQSGPPVIGVLGGGTTGIVPNAAGMIDGAKGSGGTKKGGGSSSTSIFGVVGTGTKFVYVFDRSLSMHGTPLRAAQAELVGSLASLADNHEFQIIFYNNRATVFNPAGKGRLSWATSANKELARRFVEGMTASGGTNHEEAMLEALKLQPDVIFVLSDAKSNLGEGLTAGQLDKIRRMNGSRASINSIEFGDGPQSEGYSFLKTLSKESGGQYGYIDVNTLTVRKAE